MGGALRAQRAVTRPLHVDQDLGFLRLLNVALLAPIPLLIWLTARRVGASEAASGAAALLPLAVPQLLAITAALNNDNLFTLFAVATGLAAAHIATGDLRVRTGLVAGALCGSAMFTKGFGIVLPLALAVAYLVGVVGHRWTGARGWRTAAGVGAATAATFATGGWWYGVNLARHGSLAPSIEDASGGAGPGFSPDRVFFVKRFLAWMTERFWGWFGAFDLRMSQVLIGAATVLLLAGLVAAFWPRSSPRPATKQPPCVAPVSCWRRSSPRPGCSWFWSPSTPGPATASGARHPSSRAGTCSQASAASPWSSQWASSDWPVPSAANSLRWC
ncbi:MAG: glycosyltransferase family 39 protein [Acidimicrobiales bacterium]